MSSLLWFVNTFRENVVNIKVFEVSDFSRILLFYIGARTIDLKTRRLFEVNISRYVMHDLKSYYHLCQKGVRF